MKLENKLSNVVMNALIRVGKKPGDPGFLDAMKDAVWDIHVILGKEDCNLHCKECTNPDCPVQKCYRQTSR
jgi:hypothetical protein